MVTLGKDFASRDTHMICCSEVLFKRWIDILQNHSRDNFGRQPTISMFRCLQGLDDESIEVIQSELESKNLVVARSKGEVNIMEMAERARRIKEDKALQEEILNIFRKEYPDATLDTWAKCKDHFDITSAIYEGFRGSCQSWLKEKLQASKKTPDFPSSAHKTILWLIQRKEGGPISRSAFPWQVVNVGQDLTGAEFLFETLQEKLSIGLCFLDLIFGFTKNYAWSTSHFTRLLRGVLNISTEPKQAALVAFVKHEHIKNLQDAVEEVSGWNQIMFGSVDYVPYEAVSPFVFINSYVVIVLFSAGKTFNNLERYTTGLFSPSPIIIESENESDSEDSDSDKDEDSSEHEGEEEELRQEDAASRKVKKNMAKFIKHNIKLFCKEEEVVIDVFSRCIASKQAIMHKRNVLALVSSIIEMSEVSAMLEQIAQCTASIKKWAGLDTKEAEETTAPLIDESKEHEEADTSMKEHEDTLLSIPDGPISKAGLDEGREKCYSFLSKLGIHRD